MIRGYYRLGAEKLSKFVEDFHDCKHMCGDILSSLNLRTRSNLEHYSADSSLEAPPSPYIASCLLWKAAWGRTQSGS
jgi:hypothetical protein